MLINIFKFTRTQFNQESVYRLNRHHNKYRDLGLSPNEILLYVTNNCKKKKKKESLGQHIIPFFVGIFN